MICILVAAVLFEAANVHAKYGEPEVAESEGRKGKGIKHNSLLPGIGL